MLATNVQSGTSLYRKIQHHMEIPPLQTLLKDGSLRAIQ